MTANGMAKARLSKADKVQLGKLEASNVPVVVQNVDEKSFGAGVDGLLGMSFLSRFEVQMAGGSIEIRTRSPKKQRTDRPVKLDALRFGRITIARRHAGILIDPVCDQVPADVAPTAPRASPTSQSTKPVNRFPASA